MNNYRKSPRRRPLEVPTVPSSDRDAFFPIPPPSPYDPIVWGFSLVGRPGQCAVWRPRPSTTWRVPRRYENRLGNIADEPLSARCCIPRANISPPHLWRPIHPGGPLGCCSESWKMRFRTKLAIIRWEQKNPRQKFLIISMSRGAIEKAFFSNHKIGKHQRMFGDQKTAPGQIDPVWQRRVFLQKMCFYAIIFAYIIVIMSLVKKYRRCDAVSGGDDPSIVQQSPPARELLRQESWLDNGRLLGKKKLKISSRSCQRNKKIREPEVSLLLHSHLPRMATEPRAVAAHDPVASRVQFATAWNPKSRTHPMLRLIQIIATFFSTSIRIFLKPLSIF